MRARTNGLFVALLVLTGAAAAVLAMERSAGERRARQTAAFQHLTGGLGFGPAVDLAECPFGFDPRLDPACALDRGPIPGGSCFCPRHAGSLFVYPPLRRLP